MNTFYKPSKDRYKIICEAKAFPSDQVGAGAWAFAREIDVIRIALQYALKSQIASHGFNPGEALIEIYPRKGEYSLREEDILSTIEEHGETAILVLFPSVQYYTGQWFPMEKITKAAKAKVS